MPQQPVTLTPEQIEKLSQDLARLRHDTNNHLALIVAAAEILHHNPRMMPQMVPTLLAEPKHITQKVAVFSELFDSVFGISRD